MKKLIFKIFLAIIFLFLQTNIVLAFYSDVPETHEYYNSIKTLYDLNLLPDGTKFRPDDLLKIPDLYTLLLTYGKAELSKKINLPYLDTKNNSSYAPYIQTAIDIGILKPNSSKPRLGINSTVPKHTALAKMFQIFGIGTNIFFEKENWEFTDLKSNSKLAPIAKKAHELGILEKEKNSLFKMAKRITKAEAADYLYKIYEYSQNTNNGSQISITITNLGQSSPYGETEKKLIENQSFGTLLEVWKALKNKYYYQEEINDQNLIFGAIKGMVGQVTDKYTVFQKPEEAATLITSLSKEFEGIGIVIEMIENKVTIIAPIKDSPAEQAGLKTNDIIIKVDGNSIIGESLDLVASKIKGPSGTTVTITILRNTEEKDFTVSRAFIMLHTVEKEMLSKSGKKIGYISILSFSEDTYQEFLDAVNELIAKKPNGFIIDLRNNPGGYMDVTINIISLFTDKIKTALTLEYSNGQKEEYKTNGNGLLKNYKVVVLINEGSASASEILAGALQDFGAAKIIGVKSFGKGSVQEVDQFTDKSLFKYTISKWLTPNGGNIDGKGITPDKTVANNGGDDEEDKQLDTAIAEF